MDTNQTILYDFINKHPFAAAQTLDTINPGEVADFLQTLPLESTLRLLDLMNDRKASDCFLLLPNKKTTELLEKAQPYLIASLLKLIEESEHSKFLTNVSSSKLNIIKRHMENAPNTVGAFMETALFVNREMLIDDATKLIKRHSEKEDIHLYVVDLEGTLKGVVNQKGLLLASKSDMLKDIMMTSFSKFLPDETIKNISNHPAWLDYREIPVVDKSDKLLGTLSYKTMMENVNALIDSDANEIQETGGALGELYRIGLTGLLQSVGK